MRTFELLLITFLSVTWGNSVYSVESVPLVIRFGERDSRNIIDNVGVITLDELHHLHSHWNEYYKRNTFEMSELDAYRIYIKSALLSMETLLKNPGVIAATSPYVAFPAGQPHRDDCVRLWNEGWNVGQGVLSKMVYDRLSADP